MMMASAGSDRSLAWSARRLVAFALAMAAFASSGCGDARPKRSKELQVCDHSVKTNGAQFYYMYRARQLLKEGLIEEAAADCRTCAHYRLPRRDIAIPRNWYFDQEHVVLFHEVRAGVFEARGQYPEAMSDAERAIELFTPLSRGLNPARAEPLREDLLALRGRILVDVGRLAEAESIAATLLERGTRTHGFELGMALLRKTYAADAARAASGSAPAEPPRTWTQPLALEGPTTYAPEPEPGTSGGSL
jgi:tetratricopeptide (TPR) repeat protein